MRLLLVDNQLHVIQWLTHFIPFMTGMSFLQPLRMDVESDLRKAVKLVAEKEYDVLFLRHDLEQEPKSGFEIRDFLIKNPEVNPKMLIVCHGMNEVSDTKNARLLSQAGRLAKWFPLGVVPTWQFDGREGA